jgi:hypothetical protein
MRPKKGGFRSAVRCWELGFVCCQAVIVGIEVVAFAGDEALAERSIKLPAKMLVSENFAHRHPSWRDPVEKQQAGRRV